MQSESMEGLYPTEVYWRDRYHWLLENGYRLRPRYHPEWIPSWVKDPTLWEGATEDSRAVVVSAAHMNIRLDD